MHSQMVQGRTAQARRNAAVSRAANQTANQRKAQRWTRLPAAFGAEEEEASVVVGELYTEH